MEQEPDCAAGDRSDKDDVSHVREDWPVRSVRRIEDLQSRESRAQLSEHIGSHLLRDSRVDVLELNEECNWPPDIPDPDGLLQLVDAHAKLPGLNYAGERVGAEGLGDGGLHFRGRHPIRWNPYGSG